MKKERQSSNIFKRKKYVYFFATLAAITWSFAFPLIKVGFSEFGIGGGATWDKTLFAGIRFFVAGLCILILAKILGNKFQIKEKMDWLWLLLLSLVNTTFHYFFFYIGLYHTSGSRASVLDSLSVFMLIIFACIFFKEEHMNRNKIMGCVLGILGIFIMNLHVKGMVESEFSFWGDGMIILSGFSSAFGGILTRIVTKKIDVLWTTGLSLSFGGMVMIFLGLGNGGGLPRVSLLGIVVLFLLVMVSALGFSLYNQLLRYNPVGEIAIFNALIPVMGGILSCIILRERFRMIYIFAGVLVAAGVVIVNKKDKINVLPLEE